MEAVATPIRYQCSHSPRLKRLMDLLGRLESDLSRLPPSGREATKQFLELGNLAFEVRQVDPFAAGGAPVYAHEIDLSEAGALLLPAIWAGDVEGHGVDVGSHGDPRQSGRLVEEPGCSHAVGSPPIHQREGGVIVADDRDEILLKRFDASTALHVPGDGIGRVARRPVRLVVGERVSRFPAASSDPRVDGESASGGEVD